MNGNKSKINKSPTKNKKINPFNSKLKQNKEKRDDKVSSTKTTLGSSGKSLQKVTFKKVFKESNNRNQLNELENNDLNVLKREFSRSLVEFSNKNILKNEEKLFLEQLRFQQKTSFNSNILKTIKEQISDIIHLEETSKLNEIENLFHQSTCASPEIHLKRQTFCFNILPNKQNKKKNKEILKISFNDNDLNDDMDENMRISIPQNFYHCNSLKQVDLSNTRKVFSNTEVFKEKDKDKVNETISNKRTNLLNKSSNSLIQINTVKSNFLNAKQELATIKEIHQLKEEDVILNLSKNENYLNETIADKPSCGTKCLIF